VPVTEENYFTVVIHLLLTAMAGYDYQQNTPRNVYTCSTIPLNKMTLFFWPKNLCNFLTALYVLKTYAILIIRKSHYKA
jgi:hypothetical protein